jgi:LPS-assembly protein
MNMPGKHAAILFFLLIFAIISQAKSFAQEKRVPIIVNGDKVEFVSEGKKIIAQGDVSIEYENARLSCEKVVVYNETKMAVAEGNVVLTYPKIDEQGKEVFTVIRGDKATYNFQTGQGELIDTKIESAPFYGRSRQVNKLGDEKMEAKEAYITTCDLDEPHYRFRAKEILIYPNEKIVAKNVALLVGNVPILWIPRYVQLMNDKRPRVTIVPGYSKDWGAYILTAWRYYLLEGQQGRIHLDWRERRDFAWGLTHKYKLGKLGEGVFKPYYMHERKIQSSRLWDEDRKTQERERFKVQWQHRAQINDRTTALLEYHKFKDKDFMKDYFWREYEKDEEPRTYFLLTHATPTFNLSLKTEKRVNRFYAASVERLPEIKLDTIEQRIFSSPFYFSNETTASNLRKRFPNSAESEFDAKRVDTFTKFSYPSKISFINIDPFVGGRFTYFSEDNLNRPDIFRGIFYTGIDMSTRLFRIFNVKGNFLGTEINKLRHVITPSISYSYIHRPTVPASNLLQFDSIDAIDKENKFTFSLENKLQTKRDNVSYDILRFIISSDYLLRHDPGGSRFDKITSDLEFTPADWLRFEADTSFDTRNRYFKSVNLDLSIKAKDDKWSFGFAERYERKVNRQLEMQFNYRINPKWKFSVYERFYPVFGNLKEQEYVVTRDLHCWEMSVSYNITEDRGQEIWVALRLKAFPEMGFEFNKTYRAPKSSSE